MTYIKHTKKQPLEDWHKADIVAALHKRGYSLRQLSVAQGFAPTSLSNVLHRQVPSWQKIIADVIGVSPLEIWPSRYDEDGQSLDGRKKPKQLNNNTLSQSGKGKKLGGNDHATG